MPYHNPKPKLKAAAALAVLIVVSFAGWSVQKLLRPHAAAPKVVKQNTVPQKQYDPLVLKKLIAVLKGAAVNDKPYTIAGVMSAIDNADTTQKARNVNFLFSKNGNDCYYKVKDMEMLNAGEIYLFVDHVNKRMVLQGHKDINMPAPGNLDNIAEMLKSEQYNLIDKHEGPNETIALVDEQHLTCKEYRVTYDTVSLKINRIYVRMPQVTDVTNKKKDKSVDLRIGLFTTEAHPESYLDPRKLVKLENGRWSVTKAYADYQLITM